MATVKVPAVQGSGHQDPAVPAAARVDQGPAVAAAVVPVAVPAEDPVVPEAAQDLVVPAVPAVPDPVATNKMNNCGGVDLLDKLLQHSKFPLLYTKPWPSDMYKIVYNRSDF